MNVFIVCDECCNSPVPTKVFSSLEYAKESGGHWILEMRIDEMFPKVISHFREYDNTGTWLSRDITSNLFGSDLPENEA